MSDDKNPQQLENALIKAKQLLNSNKVAEAMSLITDILNVNPDEPRALKMFEYAKNLKGIEGEYANMTNAETLFASGEYEKAMAVVQSVIKDDALNEKAIALGNKIQEKLEALPFITQYEQSGQAMFDAGNYAGAIDEWSKIKELDSSYVKVDHLISQAQAKISATPPDAPSGDLFSDEPSPELIAEKEGVIDPDDPFALDGDISLEAPVLPIEQTSGTPDLGETPELSEADIPTEIQSESTPDLSAPPEFDSSDLPSTETDTAFDGLSDVPEVEPPTLDLDSGSFEAPAMEEGVPEQEIKEDSGVEEPSVEDSFETGGDIDDFSTESTEDFDIDQSEKEGSQEQSQIDQYFNEGLELYERGQCQQAIDKWQLIFVYDENNERANEYIKKAQVELEAKQQTVSTEEIKAILAEGDHGRAGVLCDEMLAGDPESTELLQLKQDIFNDREENVIKPTLAKAEQMMNQGMFDEATAEVEKVLAFNPVHEEATVLVRSIHEARDQSENAVDDQQGEVYEDEPSALEDSQLQTSEKKSSSKLILIIAVVVIIAVCVAGYLFKDKIFGSDESAQQTIQSQSGIQGTQKKNNATVNLKKAKMAIEAGNLTDALKLLRTIDTIDPEFPEAITLIKQVEEGLTEGDIEEPVEKVLTSEEIFAQKQNQAVELVVKAKAVLDQDEFEAAKQYVDKALSLDPTNLDAMDLKDRINQKLAMATDEQKKYNEALSYYNDGLYQDSLRVFYRLSQEGKMQESCQKYIELAWFNWGVRELKNANCTEAIKKLTEFQSEANREDAEALKHIKVAERYQARAKDDSFKQYIEFIEYRQP